LSPKSGGGTQKGQILNIPKFKFIAFVVLREGFLLINDSLLLMKQYRDAANAKKYACVSISNHPRHRRRHIGAKKSLLNRQNLTMFYSTY
jgi:hypothetical protein